MSWLRRLWNWLTSESFAHPEPDTQPAPAPEQAKRNGIKINPEAAARASAGGAGQASNPFAAYRPAKGVVPAGLTSMAFDSAIDDLFGAYSLESAYDEGLAFMGYPALAMMTARPEYRRPAEILAKEMTRKWISIQAAGEEDKTEAIATIVAELERLDAKGAFRQAAEQDGFFGRSQIFIDLGDEGEELLSPLHESLEKLDGKKIIRLTVIEPMWTYPDIYDSTDPLKTDFFKPQSWFVQGKRIHGSRLMTIIGRDVPDIMKPAYAFGGLSLSQMMKPYVDNWLRTRQSVSDLLHSFNVSVLSMNMAGLLNAGAGDDEYARMDIFNRTRDNRGVLAIDKDSEEFQNVSAPLGGLDHLQAQSQEHMSAASGIPLVKLLGITPSGLNASSDGEMRAFYDWVEAQQEDTFGEHLKQLINIIQITTLGVIDKGIKIKFNPLWTLDEGAQATLRKTDMDTDVAAIGAGILDPLESRQRLAAAEDSPYAGIDVNNVPEPPQQPGVGPDGMPLPGAPGDDEAPGGEGDAPGAKVPGIGESSGHPDPAPTAKSAPPAPPAAAAKPAPPPQSPKG